MQSTRYLEGACPNSRCSSSVHDDSGCCDRARHCETEPWAKDESDAVRATDPLSQVKKPSTREDYSAHTRRCLLPLAVEVYSNAVVTRATGVFSPLAEVPAGVPITEVECRALPQSKQAERCSQRAVVTLIGHSRHTDISSRPEKQKGKIRPSMCVRICDTHVP